MRYEQDALRKLQLVELDILRDIDAVCRTHNITYFLDSGSALGAVRHGGFIPWDDDIDLGMLRADYERFLEVAPRALGDRYVVADPRKRSDQAGLFAKVWKRGTKFFTEETIDAGIDQGIFVDIFPYDPLHSDQAIARKQQRRCRLWQSVSYLRHTKHITVPHGGLLGSVERGACAVAHKGVRAFANHDRVLKSFDSWSRKGYENPSDLQVATACILGAFPKDMLLPAQEALFEGSAFPIPGNIEGYLETMYGADWRELPPLEQRRNHAPVVLDFGEAISDGV